MFKLFKRSSLLRVMAILFAATPFLAFASVSDASAVTRLNISVEPTIELTIPNSFPTINIGIPDGQLHETTMNATVTTNNPTGYTLSLLSINTSMVNTTGRDGFGPVNNNTAPEDFSMNAWGIRGSIDNLYHTPYSGLVLATSNTPARDAVETITFGAKMNTNLSSGIYDSDFTIVAIANRVPDTIESIDYLQDVNNEVIASMTVGTQYQLYDKRDEKLYFVSKLADGSVWMTQNLDFTLSAEGTVLTPEDSDVGEEKTITAVTNVANWGQSNTAAYYKSGENYYLVSGLDTPTDASSLAKDSTDRHYLIGSYYSWNAATAGTGASANANSDASESICPAGWRLPTSNASLSVLDDRSFNKLFDSYSLPTTSQVGIENTLTTNPLWMVYARQFDSTHDWTTTPTTASYWSSRSAGNDQAYAFVSTLDSTNDVQPNAAVAVAEGLNIRCVFNRNGSTRISPKAILGSNGNLNFVYDRGDYNVGEYYTDNLGETQITAVYDVPVNSVDDSSAPWWSGNGSIISANIDSSFSGFKPTGTYFWFYLPMATTVTNLNNLNMSETTYAAYMFFDFGVGLSSGAAISVNGLNSLDVSKVVDMSHMFHLFGRPVTDFSLDLSGWNVSSVKDMSFMFYEAGMNSSSGTWSFNLSNWNTGEVQNMQHMFYQAGQNAGSVSISGLGSWDLSKVETTYYMFFQAGNSAQTFNISGMENWAIGTNAPAGTDVIVSYMFMFAGYNATTWSIGDLSNWDVSHVTVFEGIFEFAGYNITNWSIGDLGNWDTSSGKSFANMFYYSGRNTPVWSVGDLGDWDFSSANSLSYMFGNAGFNSSTFDISYVANWDISNVANLSGLFNNAGIYATTWSVGDLSGWDTSGAFNMSYMFSNTGINMATFSLGDIGGWDVSNVTDMSYMFSGAGTTATSLAIGNIGNWNVSSVTSMAGMFSQFGSHLTSFSFDFHNWDVSSVTNMYRMFYYAGNYSSSVSINTTGWDTHSVTNMSGMFFGNGYDASTWNIIGITNWNTSNVTNMSDMFRCAADQTPTVNLDLSGWNTSKVQNMSGMFYDFGYASSSLTLTGLDNWNVGSVTNMSRTFQEVGYNANPTWSIGDLSNWNVGNVTDMSYMFAWAGYANQNWSVGNLNRWNTGKVKYMQHMFHSAGCNATNFSVGDLSNWNVSSVINMSYMFNYTAYYSSTWSIGMLSGWNTRNVTNMTYMFACAGYNATAFNLNLGSWNTSSVTNMSYMFYFAGRNCSHWSIGYLDDWNVGNVQNMAYMFYYAARSSTNYFSLGNLSGWNTGNVTNMQNMFYCLGYVAPNWTIGDISGWNVSSVTNHSDFINRNNPKTNDSVYYNQPRWP